MADNYNFDAVNFDDIPDIEEAESRYEQFMETERLPGIINPPRIEEFKKCYKALKLIVNGENLKFTYKMQSPSKFAAHFSVTGKNIEINNMPLFANLCERATIVEIVPFLNGNVEIDFTFYDILLPVKG